MIWGFYVGVVGMVRGVVLALGYVIAVKFGAVCLRPFAMEAHVAGRAAWGGVRVRACGGVGEA